MNTINKYIKKFSAVSIALILLFSTSGFSIYTHNCHHSNTHNVSIFIPADECGSKNSDSQVKNCCSVVEPAETCLLCEKAVDDDNCCSNSKQIIKLDTESVLNFVSPSIKVPEFNIQFFNLHWQYQNHAFNTIPFSTFPEIELPPPLIVPEFLSFIQVYII